MASRDFEEGEMVLEDNPVGLSPLQVMDGARVRLTIALSWYLDLCKTWQEGRGTRTPTSQKSSHDVITSKNKSSSGTNYPNMLSLLYFVTMFNPPGIGTHVPPVFQAVRTCS